MSKIDKNGNITIDNGHIKSGILKTKGNKLPREEKEFEKNSSPASQVGALKVLILIGLMFITIRILFNGGTSQVFSIQSLLENLQDLPSVSTSIRNGLDSLTILGDWGVFNFVRDFINIFTELFSVAMWISGSLVDVILFIVAFLKMLFV